MKSTIFFSAILLGVALADITKPANLYYYSKLETTTASDETQRFQAAVVTGTPTSVAGYNGNGVRFNAGASNTDYLTVGDVLVAGSVTYSAWVNLDNITSEFYSKIFSNKATYETDTMGAEVQYRPSTKELSLVYGDKQVFTAIANIPASTWTHVVVAASDVAAARFYINGEALTYDAMGRTSSSVTAPNTGQKMVIGASSSNSAINPNSAWNGIIDEVRIYNTTLTDSEVSLLFAETFTASTTAAPVTNAPVTNAPVTNAPVTNAPVTNPPANSNQNPSSPGTSSAFQIGALTSLFVSALFLSM